MTSTSIEPRSRWRPGVLAAPTRPAARAAGEATADSGWLVGLLLGLGVLSVLPLVPWYRDMDGYAVALSALHALVCAVGAAVACHRGLRPCLLVASVFPYCWLVVPAAFQLSHEVAAWGDPGVVLDPSSALRAQLVLLLGQLALLLGYAASAARARTRSAAWRVPDEGRGRLLAFALLALLGTWLLVPFVISAAGGVGALFQSRQDFNAALVRGGITDNTSQVAAVVKIVPSSLATCAAVLGLWLARQSPAGDPWRRRGVVVTVGAVAALLVVANPFAFTRYVVAAAFGSVVLAWLAPRRRRAALTWLGLTLFVFLLAYPAANFFRRGTTSPDGYLLATPDFDGFQQAINTVSFVDDRGITWGSHLFSGLFFFVPRDLWAGKAVPATIPVSEARGYNFTNLSMPLPAEAYLDLGWVGVVLVLGLVGLLWHRLDEGWLDGSRLAVLAAYVAVAQVGMWRGPFGSLAPVFGFTIALLVAALVASSRITPPGRRGDPAPAPPVPSRPTRGPARPR